jgi:hypothetical protein
MTTWSTLPSGTTKPCQTRAMYWHAKHAATKRSWWFTKALTRFLSFNALRVAAILAVWAGRPIQIQIQEAVGNKVEKLMRHVRKVEAESHYWKERYRGETGSLRGRIRQLEDQLQERRGDERG